jgi:ribose transport system permease protein
MGAGLPVCRSSSGFEPRPASLFMKKTLGITLLLVLVCVLTAIKQPNFFAPYNAGNLMRFVSMFAILGIGAALVIMTGGIDLSIGSVVGLVGVTLAWLLGEQGWSVPAALAVCTALALAIGLFHGLLITQLKLQPFVVTLCGLLIYRGMARSLTNDQTVGFGNSFDGLRYLANGQIPLVGDYWLPVPLLALIAVGAVTAVFLNLTIWGRHLLATGRNEEAARYSGLRTSRYIILAYVLCSLLAGLGGVLFALYVNTVQPDNQGNFYELYGIAAAVLGGCSLRGGEGSVLGVIVGAALMRVLTNAVGVLGLKNQWEFAIIGIVILAAVIVDEVLRRARKASA